MSNIALPANMADLVTQPVRYSQQLAVQTETDAIRSGLPALAQIRRTLGTDGQIAVQAILTKLIQDLVSFFNVGKTMNERQCADTVRLLLADYYYLNLADLRICFDRLKAGKYGRSYDRIDGQVILMALDEYCRGRTEAAEILSQESHTRRQQEQNEERYYIKTGGYYLHADSDGQYHETTREEATAFSFEEVHELRRCFADYSPEIEPTTQPDEGLIAWMRRHAPGLLHITQRSTYLSRRQQLIDLKTEIGQCNMSDEEISERVNNILK